MSFGQGGPFGPGDSDTPDWEALAEESEAKDRRRRWLVGGSVAAVVVAGAVAAVVVVGTGDAGRTDGLPGPEKLPTAPKQPSASFSEVSPPAPPHPLEFLRSAEKDTAPLTAATLFPGSSMTADDRTYDRAATASTSACASAASSSLGAVLTRNGCTQMIRATFVRNGVAVTVGVAVFDSERQARSAKEQATGNVQSLAGGGVPLFCRSTACRLSTNSVGRYTYFTVAGYTSGEAVTNSDTQALQAGKDAADHAFRSIVRRGQLQASAAATASAG